MKGKNWIFGFAVNSSKIKVHLCLSVVKSGLPRAGIRSNALNLVVVQVDAFEETLAHVVGQVGLFGGRVDYQKLSSDRLGESSASIRARVDAARKIQRDRFAESPSIACNADMRIAEVRKFCKLDETSETLMRLAMSQMNLSAWAYHRILKLARTIADLGGSESIQPPHLAEALHYRPKLMLN